MTDHEAQMRGFIVLAEEYASRTFGAAPTPTVERVDATPAPAPLNEAVLFEELRALSYKLRAYESNDGADAMGVMLGMERAAEMVDNFVRRHTDKD